MPVRSRLAHAAAHVRAAAMDILSLARAHLSEALQDPADGLPDPGSRWGTLAAWSRQNIASFRSVEEAVHFAQRPSGHGGFEARYMGEDLIRHATLIASALLRDCPQAAPHLSSFVEPGISRPETTMIYGGRRISSPLNAHMLFYFSCAARVPKMDQVCEIGGGFGAQARLFLTNSYRRPQTYVIVDLPESLFFAEVYLRATLGRDRVHYVQGREPPEAADGDVLLCPLTRLQALRSTRFDLVLNTHSMQEMTDAYITFYRHWLDEQDAGYFYSFNYFMHGVDSQTECGNTLAPRLSERWEVVWSPTWGDPPFLCTHVLAKRADPRTIDHRNKLTIEQHFKRPLAVESVYPLLHVAETSRDARFRFQLMAAMVEDFEFRPRELLFLAGLIEAADPGSSPLTDAERRQVRELRSDLARRLANSVPRVPPHLVDMQRELYAPAEPRPTAPWAAASDPASG